MIRFVMLVVGFGSLQQDPDAYVALSQGWAASGSYALISNASSETNSDSDSKIKTTAYRPPLYPWVLSWLTRHQFRNDGSWTMELSRFAVAALHWILGIATAILTMQITQAWLQSLGESLVWPAYFAGLLVAADPILLRQSTLVMTETLATFLTAWVLWQWSQQIDRSGKSESNLRQIWFGFVGIGLLLGLSVLCRPAAMVWATMLLIFLASVAIFRRQRRLFVSGLGLLFGMVLVLTPWFVRNWRAFGEPIWATTHGGYTLLLANNPILFDHFEKTGGSRTWDEEAFHRWWQEQRLADSDQIGEVSEDRLAGKLAWQTIRERPTTFVKASVYRVGWLWALWPDSRHAGPLVRWSVGFYYASVFGLAIIGLFRGMVFMGRKPIWRLRFAPAVLLILSLTLVHAIYWSNMRMRSVAVPAVAIFAGLAFVRQRHNSL